MAPSNSANDARMHGMHATPLTSMTANEIKSLPKDDLNAALSLSNTQADTNLTAEDIEAALILVNLSASTTDKPTTPIHKRNNNSMSKAGQNNEIESQQQERRKYFTAYQRERRAKMPKGHRKAEYRKYIDKETDAHRNERLRKRNEMAKAKREEAERAE